MAKRSNSLLLTSIAIGTFWRWRHWNTGHNRAHLIKTDDSLTGLQSRVLQQRGAGPVQQVPPQRPLVNAGQDHVVIRVIELPDFKDTDAPVVTELAALVASTGNPSVGGGYGQPKRLQPSAVDAIQFLPAAAIDA